MQSGGLRATSFVFDSLCIQWMRRSCTWTWKRSQCIVVYVVYTHNALNFKLNRSRYGGSWAWCAKTLYLIDEWILCMVFRCILCFMCKLFNTHLIFEVRALFPADKFKAFFNTICSNRENDLLEQTQTCIENARFWMNTDIVEWPP